MTFQVHDKVRIKETASFGLASTQKAFEDAGRIGVVEAITDTLLHDNSLVVYTLDRTAWEYFLPDELERIEEI